MQRLEVSGAVRPIYRSLGVKRLIKTEQILTIFFHGATAPSGQRPPYCRGFTITLRHAILGRLLWVSDQPNAETSTRQRTTITRDSTHVPPGIRTRNPTKREAADSHLRLRGHQD